MLSVPTGSRLTPEPTLLRVSVVVPTRNRADLLVNAIRSVAAQTYPVFEILVIDDASNDGTVATVQDMRSAQIRYVRHERPRGGSSARNTGIRLARGHVIGFLDDDDEWEPDKLGRQVSLFEQYDGMLCMYTMDGRSVKGGRGVQVSLNELRRGFARGGSASALIVRADVAKELLFDESLPRCQDWDFCIRLAQRYRLGCLNEALVRYNDGRHHRISNASVGLPVEIVERRYRMLEKHRQFFGEKWYRRHMCRFLLYAMHNRPNIGAHLAYVVRRYGAVNVARTLTAQGLAVIRRSIGNRKWAIRPRSWGAENVK